MKTRIAWFAVVVLFAFHGAAWGDFIATATLTGDGEDPNSPGTGSGTVTFTSSTDSLLVSLTFANLSSPTVPVDSLGSAHIHFGIPGNNGPVLFPFPNFPSGVTSGTFSTVLTAADLMPDPTDGIITFADAVSAIERGDTYFNIHTVAFPDGEIRGQITLVPEPASLITLALGFGGVLAIAVRTSVRRLRSAASSPRLPR
jgi:hypothetical protein